MTQEELAILAKQGDAKAAESLYLAVEPLLYKLAASYFPLCARAGMERNDLRQELYFAFLQAVQAFRPESGYRFTAFLKFPIRTVCRKALHIREQKLPDPPLSLDAPLHQTENFTLADMLVDETDMTHAILQQDFAKAVRDALNSLPAHERDAIIALYFDKKTAAQTAKQMHTSISKVRYWQQRAFEKLQRNHIMQQLFSVVSTA